MHHHSPTHTFKHSHPRFLLASLIAAALTVTACGGGGGTDSGATIAPATPAAPVNPPAVTSVPLVTNAANAMPSNYPSSSAERKVFDDINTARGLGGFGLLVQDTHLDQAAAQHAVYFTKQYDKPFYFTSTGTLAPYTGVEPLSTRYLPPILNSYDSAGYSKIDPITGSVMAHIEVAGQPGFTGTTPDARARATGYIGAFSFDVREVIGFESATNPGADNCVTGLLRTVFHRGGLLEPSMVDVGVGTQVAGDGRMRACVLNVSNSRTAPAKVPDGWVGVYPGVGVTGMFRTLGGEVPNPVPEFDVQGLPVSLYVGTGRFLKVTTFTLSAPGNVPVPVKLLQSKDFGFLIGSHQAYIVPNGALLPNTTYTVNFVGQDSSRDLVKTWTFTTGAN